MSPQKPASVEMTVSEIAAFLEGSVLGHGDRPITGASSLETAGPGDLAFADGPKRAKALAVTQAGAVILPDNMTPPEGVGGIVVPHPALAMANVVSVLKPMRRLSGVSERAHVGDSVELGEGVGIGAARSSATARRSALAPRSTRVRRSGMVVR